MSKEQTSLIAETAAFLPRSRLWELHELDVPFDQLASNGAYEQRAITRITEGACVAVIGPSGTGKSSVIAWLCYQLPPSHFALRIPIAALDELAELYRHSMGDLRRVLAAAQEPPNTPPQTKRNGSLSLTCASASRSGSRHGSPQSRGQGRPAGPPRRGRRALTPVAPEPATSPTMLAVGSPAADLTAILHVSRPRTGSLTAG